MAAQPGLEGVYYCCCHYCPQHYDRDHEYRGHNTFESAVRFMLLQLVIPFA